MSKHRKLFAQHPHRRGAVVTLARFLWPMSVNMVVRPEIETSNQIFEELENWNRILQSVPIKPPEP